MSRKVCVVTGSRAEYGLLRPVMRAIQRSRSLDLQLVATGSHLSPEHGNTYEAIESDGFRIDHKVDTLLSSDAPNAIAKSIGLGLIGMGDAFAQLQPDLVLVLGDRYEILAAATAALVAAIPLAHLHGGETTEGAFDEAIRHSITKMSHLHFVAAEEYGGRVAQLGESAEHIFVVGGLGVDAIKQETLLQAPELEAALGFKLARKSLLITFHPETLEPDGGRAQLAELLATLATLDDTSLIFTAPNADPQGLTFHHMIEQFVAQRRNARLFSSLGTQRYLSCIKHADAVVGNSSSGLTEVPSFRKPTINIGGRQRGRLRAESVIDCQPTREAIAAALRKAYSTDFQRVLAGVKNPYGDGGAAERILGVLETVSLDGILKKPFVDLRFPTAPPKSGTGREKAR